MSSAARRHPLPPGVQVYLLAADGTATLATGGATADLSGLGGFLPFIDDGQQARYFIGDQYTSPERPSNATVKLGVVRPHSGFTPHAHGGEHFVLSLGYAACGLYDHRRDAVVQVRLTPGMMIRIPALLPHSFANRASGQLLILAANTGFGIDHEDYAITAAEAERRASSPAGAGSPAGVGPPAGGGFAAGGGIAAGAGPSGGPAGGAGPVERADRPGMAEQPGTAEPPDAVDGLGAADRLGVADYRALARALRAIDAAGPPAPVAARERLAGLLRRWATRLEAPR